MTDFLRQNPFISIDEYKWSYSVPLTKLMSYDFTHVVYLDNAEPEKKEHKKTTPKEFINDLGFPIFKE